MSAVVAADAAVLSLLRPDVARAWGTVRHPRVALAERGADGALLPLAGSVVWLVAAWLGLGLAAALAARLPGAAGQAGALLAGRLLPRALLSVASGSAGLGLLLAPMAVAAPVADRPPPAWPVTPQSAPAWPSGGHLTPTPTSKPGPPAGPPPNRPHAVTVRAGDSLWTIAAAELGPRPTPAHIAREWPRWFAANRSVIGADPDRIHPGQRLVAPRTHNPPSSPEDRP